MKKPLRAGAREEASLQSQTPHLGGRGQTPLCDAPAVYGTVLIQLTIDYSMYPCVCQARVWLRHQNFRVLSLMPGPIVEEMTTERR